MTRAAVFAEPGTVTAWSAGTGDRAVSAREAMTALVMVSWQRWQYYAALLREQVKGAGQRDRKPGKPDPQLGGIIGVRTGASAAAGGLYVTGEAIRSLVELEGTERERCARLLVQAHNMGITAAELNLAPHTPEMKEGNSDG